MSYFVIMRKSDFKLMPDFKGAAGGSYVDPDNPNTHKGVPRLFKRETDAKTALKWWAAGRVRMSGGKVDFGDEFGSNENIIMSSEAVAGRNIDDWVVRPASLSVTM